MNKNQKIEEVLTRGAADVLPSKNELAGLMRKKKIRLYLGIDPTGAKLHLGHTIALRKLQQFADLGHEAILLIGTGTVLAGDPSERDKARPQITGKEIKQNIATWKKQASKVLDFSQVKIKHNGDWLLELKLKDVIDIASHITAVRLFKRDMFQKRLKKGDTVWTHETLYPLLQGYDSVALDADLEIGGTDQTFNMLIGRDLQRKMRNREKFVLTTKMILGTDGKQMSKTSGNCIWIDDSAKEMFGKVMSLPDELIGDYFEFCTNVSLAEINAMKKEMAQKKVNPRGLKTRLAKEITAMYHSKKAALAAEKEFERVFKQKMPPLKMPLVKIRQKKLNILDLLVKTGLTCSKTEAKRLVLQGGAKIGGQVQTDWKKIIKIKKGLILQAGKRRFVKIG